MGASGDLIASRYRLESLLGHGGFGEVWKALDTHRNLAVALKLIKDRNRGATWREATILTALRSEHILEVHNADVFIDVPYLDTALAVCSLDQRAYPYGAEPGLATDWMRRALRGLDLCHNRRLLHRDVKPENVFLTAQGDARLGDFGVAELMDASGTADPHGDPFIRAPELLTGGRASVASDVYSAACTLYAILAGRSPFAGITTKPELEAAIIGANYPALRDLAPHVSQALADKVRIGMAVDPATRFASAAAFDSALALSATAYTFTPQPPHVSHERCWLVAGRGTPLAVCVIGDGTGRRVDVEARHAAGSKSRVRKHCFQTTRSNLSKNLRAVFSDLR
ncbi:serine/threonine-protein kinase [Nocardioides sp.]|uniref:serine/threonine-protein kinase n=1 Tax=Nocardioides sp. TaxID=35761 RepID=UPI0035183EEB